jgi:hypothetical protein
MKLNHVYAEVNTLKLAIAEGWLSRVIVQRHESDHLETTDERL